MCGGSPKPPPPTNPYDEANAQQGLNLKTMEQTQLAQQPNLYNPFGSQTWTQTGTGPDGQPIYSQTQALSPQGQAQLGQYQAFQGAAGSAGSNLMNAAQTMYGGGVPNFIQGADSMTNQMMGHELGYLSPFFGQQTDQLNTQLANQGLTPGTPAYDNAMRSLRTNQGQTVSGFLAQAEPAAFSQSVQQYELPFQMAQQMSQAGAPPGLSFSNTPSYNMQPANLIGAVGQQQQTAEQQYANQLNQQSAMMQGLAGLGSSAMLAGALGSAGAGAGAGAGMLSFLPFLAAI